MTKYKPPTSANTTHAGVLQNIENQGEFCTMKATGIVRRIDDLGRVVIPKEIRRTMRIREGDPSQITLTQEYQFYAAMREVAERMGCFASKS